MPNALHYPLAGRFRISQRFGARYLYFGKARAHQGVDFACPQNKPVLAAHDGRVSLAKLDESKSGYGNEIRVETDGAFTQYAHLESLKVKLGDRVAAGEIIGYSGNSGFTLGINGEHLHFGLFQTGSWRDPVPLLVFQDTTQADDRKHAGLTPAKIYAVQAGDTLSAIAERYYGAAADWQKIAAANDYWLSDPDTIAPGQKLILPDL